MIALRSPRLRAMRQQRGVVLFVALIVLIVMTLAGLALLRQMGAGTSIAGNIAFKENATSVADRGTEVANQWIVDNSAITATDAVALGYLSSWTAGSDPAALDWDNQSRTLLQDFVQTGNRIRYIIQRLCETANMSAINPAQRCSDFVVDATTGSRGGAGYPGVLSTITTQPFFRITTRVDGPRNTVSYTQAVVR